MKTINTKFSTYMAWVKVKLTRINATSQIYTHKYEFQISYNFYKTYGGSVGFTLSYFFCGYGAPNQIAFDGTAIQMRSKTKVTDLIC